jgi:uncharacterized membrane protein
MSSNLVVLAFDGPQTAAGVLKSLEAMQKEGDVVIKEAVVASRHQGTAVELTQSKSITDKFVKRGGGIGLIAGLLLGGPLFGAVAGASIGLIHRRLKDFGLDEQSVRQIADSLQPDSSALFLLVEEANEERSLALLNEYHGRVIKTTLSEEQESAVRQALEE